jgi:hypothetical protein
MPVNLKRIAELPELKLYDKHPEADLITDYLKRFDYLDPSAPVAQGILHQTSADGPRNLQKQFGRPQTGTLNAPTREFMAADRCGLPDPVGPLDFATMCAWNRRNLTYAFGTLSAQVGNAVAVNAVRRAFATWMASTARRLNTLFARIAAACAALLTAGVLLQSAGVRAESFEAINYTPPPGWAVQNAQDARALFSTSSHDSLKAYTRPDNGGYIVFNGAHGQETMRRNPEAAFQMSWRELVERVAGIEVPPPQIQRTADCVLASGDRLAHFINGINGHARLYIVLGKERRLGIVGIAMKPEALREVNAFFGTVMVTECPVPTVPPPSALSDRWTNVKNSNELFEFTDRGLYSYETPSGRSTGTFRVQADRLILTDSGGRVASFTFRLRCSISNFHLELDGERIYEGTYGRC